MNKLMVRNIMLKFEIISSDFPQKICFSLSCRKPKCKVEKINEWKMKNLDS